MSSRPLSSLSLSSSTLSKLTRGGYETLQDLQATSAESLAQDFNIPTLEAETIWKSSQRPLIQSLAMPLTQSAASMANRSRKFSTKSPPVDKILDGGLSMGYILEVSGPPGTPKETIATNLVTSFVEAGHEVIFIDAQNMTSPAALNKALQKSNNLPPSYSRLVYHLNVQTVVELMALIYNLPLLLNSHPKAALLVLNSISFPFQGAQNMSIQAKTSLLEKIKQALAKVVITRNLTVKKYPSSDARIDLTSSTMKVVTTSQLSTKILNADGSPGSFDTGAKGVMVPQLGSVYLPSGRTHRVIFATEGQNSGFIKLLSSPNRQQGTGPPLSAPYETTIGGVIVGTTDLGIGTT